MGSNSKITINGILPIDKPEGISSAAVVAKIKKKLGVKKVGHTGTLDPFATGLMLCGINNGTKLSQFFLGSSKHYIAEVILGTETDTYDITGRIIKKCSSEELNTVIYKNLTDNKLPDNKLTCNKLPDNKLTDTQLINKIISETILKFKGAQMQHPPVYSALKHNGKPLYQLAREGHPVQKPPRNIEIYSLEVNKIENLSELKFSKSKSENFKSEPDDYKSEPENYKSEPKSSITITLSIHCSSGTYIRSLAHDIGQQLGCGGCLASLRRTQTKGFSINDAISLRNFEDMTQEEAFNRIIPMSETLPFMPAINADNTLMEKIRFGRFFQLSEQLSSQSSEQLSSQSSEQFPSQSSEQFPSQSSKQFPSQLSNINDSVYFKVLDSGTEKDSRGELAAIVRYDRTLDKYDYCCVFAN